MVFVLWTVDQDYGVRSLDSRSSSGRIIGLLRHQLCVAKRPTGEPKNLLIRCVRQKRPTGEPKMY